MNTSLSDLFKPYSDRIKLILSNKNSILTIEELEKDKEIVKAAFNEDLLDEEEYQTQIQALDEAINEIKTAKQDYADAIIYDFSGKILLLHRTPSDGFEPDTWSLPGGKIEKDETPDQAVLREVKEETNLNVISSVLTLKKDIEKGSIYYFFCEVDNIETIILDPNEHTSFEFIDLTDQDEVSKIKFILDLKDTLLTIQGTELTSFDLVPVYGKEHSLYSNIEEQIANIQNYPKDIFMLTLFDSNEIEVDDYIDYIEKAHTDPSHGGKLIKLTGKDKNNKKVTKWVTKKELKQLANHAKNTSQLSLESAIKEHDNPTIREHAHKELERRKKEEVVQVEKDSHEKHEYHGKDWKYSKVDNAYFDEEGNQADSTKLTQYFDQRAKELNDKYERQSKDLVSAKKEQAAAKKKQVQNFYATVKRTAFSVKDNTEIYNRLIDSKRLEKLGLSSEDIDHEKLKRIIKKKLS